MHFDRMLPFFKKDPGISNTTGERFCLFSINKMCHPLLYGTASCKILSSETEIFPLIRLVLCFTSVIDSSRRSFVCSLIKLSEIPRISISFSFVSMRFVKTQAAGSHLCNSEIDCNKVPVHLFFIAHRTHRDFKPCFFVFHRKNLLFCLPSIWRTGLSTPDTSLTFFPV